MKTDQNLPINYTDKVELTIPQFGSTPSIVLDVGAIKRAEGRILEAKVINPATYNELEYVFNEGYRESRKHLSEIGYQITRAEKALREAKSIAILDYYPEYLKQNKLKDNATIRDAFLERQPDYVAAQDRIDMLKALESLFEGKVRNFENVCRYIRKQMDLFIRSGVDASKYLR